MIFLKKYMYVPLSPRYADIWSWSLDVNIINSVYLFLDSSETLYNLC